MNSLDAESIQSRELYELMFTVMYGDTYLASASIVSNSGKVRASTHIFPEVYDLRYHGNDWDMSSVINQNSDVSPLQASSASKATGLLRTEGRSLLPSLGVSMTRKVSTWGIWWLIFMPMHSQA